MATMRIEQGPEFEVVWPLGVTEDRTLDIPPRLADLSGRRIGLLWDGLFRGDELYEVLKFDVGEQFKSVSFVDHDEFGSLQGHDEDEVFARLPDLLRSTGVESVVVSVGA